jgi:hypothetical protein
VPHQRKKPGLLTEGESDKGSRELHGRGFKEGRFGKVVVNEDGQHSCQKMKSPRRRRKGTRRRKGST